ncbi:MAG: YhcH/YjgK/YiaL family protein [Bacteroidaceae bacterium]|nr:YhcH/YjgK/YiaL family protein [Bacteroidaceae bacterium]
MILDSLENLASYAALNPLFAEAIRFLQDTDLASLEPGKIVLEPDRLIVNVNAIPPKTAEEAKLETHVEFIDIQVPITAEETMGYTPAADLPEAPYDASIDMALYPGRAANYFILKPGMFAIFFPADGHAPGITPTGLKKIIIKVKC